MPKKKQTKPKLKQPKPAKLPNSWSLLKKTWLEYSTFWKPLIGVSAVYGVLYFVLVMGLSFSMTLQDTFLDVSGRLGDALTSVFSTFSTSSLAGGTSSDMTILVQFLLFLVASMAFIWTLRKLQALKKIKLRDAYYKGTSSLIATTIVSVILVATLLPLLGASSIVSAALQAGSHGTEMLIVSLIAGVLLLLAAYLFAMYWPAFYIISLPNTRPFQALKSALKITKKRRLSIIRKMLLITILMFVVILTVLIPVAMLLPSIVQVVSFILLFLIFGFVHTYLYTLYRSML